MMSLILTESGFKSETKYDIAKREFESMSSNDIINLLSIPNKTYMNHNSPMFILPNGSICSVEQVDNSPVGYKLFDDDYVHSDMVHIILNAISKQMGMGIIHSNPIYNDDKLSHLTHSLGWIRINSGAFWDSGKFYCVLPDIITNYQYKSLEKWLECGYDDKKQNVIIYAGRDEVSKTYSFEDNFPEDVIKKIKRYFSSGTWYESLVK